MNDVEYIGLRAQQEREAAVSSAHLQARQAHLEMAERYVELAVAISEYEQMMGINTSDDPSAD
jgi:vacuolar-type H+-ATPase subunit E/Vma4